MKAHEVLCCSFPEWYPKFEKCTINSAILEIPLDVLNYLLDKGTLVLPESSHSTHRSSNGVGSSNGGFPKVTLAADAELQSDDDDSDDDDVNDWNTDASSPAVKAPGLEEFSNKIRDAIAKLGGKVFPKLNWTAPKDAAWMSYTNSLQCCTPADVYLLLKSSNLLHRDLKEPFQGCSDEGCCAAVSRPALVLRRWREINPSFEFRCFVTSGSLMGFCSRDVSQFYPCLGAERSSIVSDINSFWREKIDNRFPLRDYVFDCVRLGKDRVLLVDFSPLDQSRTNALLYDWQELSAPPPAEAPLLPPLVTLQENSRLEDIEVEICDSFQTMNLHNSESSSNGCDAATDSNRVSEALVERSESSAHQATEQLPEFRYISAETGVQPNFDRMHGLPVDFLDLCSGSDPYKMMDLLKLKVQSQQDDSSDDGDDT